MAHSASASPSQSLSKRMPHMGGADRDIDIDSDSDSDGDTDADAEKDRKISTSGAPLCGAGQSHAF
jgi:hypothetical protein